jgi:hypothetical protein
MDIASVVTTVGVLAGAATGITSLFLVYPRMKRVNAEGVKVDVDASAALSDAAIRQLNSAVLRAEAAESRAREAEVRADDMGFRIDQMEHRMAAYQWAAVRHKEWDTEIKQRLLELNIYVPDPPDLVPLLKKEV